MRDKDLVTPKFSNNIIDFNILGKEYSIFRNLKGSNNTSHEYFLKIILENKNLIEIGTQKYKIISASE